MIINSNLLLFLSPWLPTATTTFTTTVTRNIHLYHHELLASLITYVKNIKLHKPSSNTQLVITITTRYKRHIFITITCYHHRVFLASLASPSPLTSSIDTRVGGLAKKTNKHHHGTDAIITEHLSIVTMHYWRQ